MLPRSRAPVGRTSAVRMALAGKNTLTIFAENTGIRIGSNESSSTENSRFPFCKAVPQPDGRSWRIADRHMRGNFLEIRVMSGHGKYEGDSWTITPAGRALSAALRFGSAAELGQAVPTFEEAAKDAADDWRRFRAKMPTVSPDKVPVAEKAWLNLWSCYVPATPPNFVTDVILMGKTQMNAVWPWDHCFNALALGYGDPDAGFDQLMVPFWKQLPDGGLPDRMTFSSISTDCTKPPIHGWALGKLLDAHPLQRDQLELLYPRLVKWTEFWFTARDRNHNGIPGFGGGEDAGLDSGWDNSTCVDTASADYEAPELQAFLVLQMRTLARVAKELGKPQEAASWRKRAESHLALFREKFWKDGKLGVLRKNGKELDTEFTGLEPLMCWVLGELLTPDEQKDLLRRMPAYETEFGLATEMPTSPQYRSDGYWRGPIWAPATYLVVDGLARAGHMDEARRLAAKFDRLVTKAGGYYENFDSKTGEGRRCKGYTWTSAVHVLLLHEYPQPASSRKDKRGRESNGT